MQCSLRPKYRDLDWQP